jgi:fatty-acyl-CoA synthase
VLPLSTPLSLSSRLQRAADRAGKAVTFINGPARVRVPWGQLHEEASAVGAALQARGIAPGDHVAILGPTSRALVTTIQGCWLAGAASMVLPLPMRMGSIDEFVRSTRARIRHGDAKLLLIDDELAPFYEATPGDPPMASLGALQPRRGNPKASALDPPAPDPDRLVILQYTSGSTSEPKGVMIPDRVLGANLDALTEAAEMDIETDVMVSWLPLYHDMGLVGLLTTSMSFGLDLVQAAPQDFLAHPGNWLEWISTYRGTATAGPNFSWVLAARALRRIEGIDLSSLRIALNGAEPIDPDAVDAFVAAAAPFGFHPGAVFCAFGMAEVGIAGTFPAPMQGMRCDAVDRVVLEEKRVAEPAPAGLDGTRRLPLLGQPVPGLEIRIVEPSTGEVLGDRQVGELQLRGTSVTPGYYKRPDATAELLRDGWLHTGDLGYLLDGELVLCGRIKDVIIVGGRNVFPEDIERAVGTIDGVRAGNVIAFGVDGYKGKESVVVVAETRGGDRAAVERAVHERVLQAVGLPAREVMLVQAGSLPKTSSGKLQRALCKERYLNEELLTI